MAKLTTNFTIEELTFSETAKRKNLRNEPSEEYLNNLKDLCEDVLEPLRTAIKSPLKITSGYRDKVVNHLVGGAANSQHIRGEAVDCVATKLTVKAFFEKVKELVQDKKLEVDQCIYEFDSWVHISYTRRRKNRNQFLIINKQGRFDA